MVHIKDDYIVSICVSLLFSWDALRCFCDLKLVFFYFFNMDFDFLNAGGFFDCLVKLGFSSISWSLDGRNSIENATVYKWYFTY